MTEKISPPVPILRIGKDNKPFVFLKGANTKPNSGSFKKGVFHAGRAKTYYKKGNYYGRANRDEFANARKETMSNHTERKEKRRQFSKVIKEAREIQDMARAMAPDALSALNKIIKSKTAADQAVIQAANSIIDRGYGKAAQTNINANVNADGKPSEISAADLDQRLTEALKRVEELTSRTRKEEPGEDQPTDLRKYN